MMEEFETFFHELLDLARDTIRPVYFSPDLVVESKADDTPVTFADRETERVLRERIEAKYGNLIPILTKAIQELSAANEALVARVAALENA